MADIYIDEWLKKINVDFYNMFINAWIPFNAWYMRQYYDFENKIDSDKAIINIIKTEDNPYKTKISTLLQGDSDESKSFKEYIKKLYHSLEAVTIPNEQNRISFRNLKLHDNPKKQHIETFNRKSYKFEYLHQQPRTTKRFKCDIIKANQISDGIIELHKCVLSELEEQADYINLNNRIKQIVQNGFNEINPSKPTSILSDAPGNRGVQIDENIYFINNNNLVCQFIIEMLYQLRCKIFHGEIDPKQNYHSIYENAYQIQRILVKSLI